MEPMIISNELVASLIGKSVLVALIALGVSLCCYPGLRSALSPTRGGLLKSGRPSTGKAISFVLYALLLLAGGLAQLRLSACNQWDSGQLNISLTILTLGILYSYTLLAGRMRQILVIIPVLQLVAGVWIIPLLIFSPLFSALYAAPMLGYLAVGILMLVLARNELKENRTIPSTVPVESR